MFRESQKQVLADGTDLVLSGSVLVGESIEMYGVNPTYLRSVGYNGFDKTPGTGDRDGGFMLFSGSVGTAIGASETYNGVGIEIVQKGPNPHQNSFLQFHLIIKEQVNQDLEFKQMSLYLVEVVVELLEIFTLVVVMVT